MKKKFNKSEFLRSWGLPDNYQWRSLRYKNPPEKGVYWYYFSRYIRERDVRMWGTCISCGKPITFDTCDAGHFMPASGCGRDLLFDERNVNAECSRCNAWDDTHLLGYAEGLDTRYGIDTSMTLRLRKRAYEDGPRIKDWKASEYLIKITALPGCAHLPLSPA